MSKGGLTTVIAQEETWGREKRLSPLRESMPTELGNHRRYRGDMAAKRSLDRLGGLLLFILFAPLMFIVAVFIYLTFSGPLVHKQVRVGLGGQEFYCYKFRTMVQDAQEVLEWYLENHPQARSEWELRLKLKEDPRVTRWGRFLRSWSLDEFPQLWNVIKGDMSLVGPRPLLSGEIEIYGSGYQNYCRFKPGITGLWQVSGRNCLTFAERAQLDAWYINHWSLILDFQLLLRTVSTALGRRGAY